MSRDDWGCGPHGITPLEQAPEQADISQELIRKVEALRTEPGDMIVLTVSKMNPEQMKRIREAILACYSGRKVAVIQEGMTLHAKPGHKSYCDLSEGGIVLPDEGRMIRPGEHVTCNCCGCRGTVIEVEGHERVVRYEVSFEYGVNSIHRWMQPDTITPCIDP